MQLTSTTDYAIRIVCYLVAQRQMISTSELSQKLRLMAGSGIKAKVLGGFLSSKGLLTGNVVDSLPLEMQNVKK